MYEPVTFVYYKSVWLTAVYHPSVIPRDEMKLSETEADFRKIKDKPGELK